MSDHHDYCTGDFCPDDIVISGISGRFPQCNSLEELKEALLTQKQLVFETNERYEKGAEDSPFGSSGTIADIDKFDNQYFGYSAKTADQTDPVQRVILEVSYEAIADSGYDPSTELKGEKIGVYTAITNDTGKELIAGQGAALSTFGTGFLRAMGANRCSYHFDFTGPSYTMDSACSSSFVSLWTAYNDIREGRVEAALVNAGQLSLTPATSRVYISANMLSMTCEINPFDARANGVVETEAVTAFFIQKASKARRAYATIMHVKHGAGGHDANGYYVPSYNNKVRVCTETLKEAGLNPNEFQYIEAHGSGAPLGDSIEVKALETVYCQGRDEPLYIGSVKSNLGLSEASSGQTATIKALFAFESGMIAPNYRFQAPNPNCEALVKGTMKVLTEPMPLKSEYISVNTLGLGGSILHAIFKKNSIEYSNIPTTEDIPRLILYPATSEAAIHSVFDYIKIHPELRSEFFALLNKLSFTSTAMKPFRGYALFQKDEPVIHVQNAQRTTRPQLWFIMTGLGSQWPGMGLEMMQIKVFAESMNRSAAVLQPLGVDLFQLLKCDPKDLGKRSLMTAFVTIAAIEIALIDVLRTLDIHPDGVIGHSIGEVVCAYVDGCCTAEQTILLAYWQGKIIDSAGLDVGLMVAIGLTREEAVRRCPQDVTLGCHNAEDSFTISGLREPVEKFVAELQHENVFVRVVDSCGYALHSQHLRPAHGELRRVLSDVLPDPKPRTESWISTSYAKDEWDKDDCKVAGPEYFAHNLTSTVLFSDAISRIPSGSVTVEISPHCLLKSILMRSIGSNTTYINLMHNKSDNNIGFFLESIGKLYTEGLNPRIENLYSPVKFPVPRGTPMICDLIKWNHSQSFFTPKWEPNFTMHKRELNLDSEDKYLLDYVIGGRSIFPATGYVWLAWEALAEKVQKKMDSINVVIENLKIHRKLDLKHKNITFGVTIMDSTGNFEITENDSLVASGIIYEEEDDMVFCEDPPIITQDSCSFVPGEDIYNELRIEGYEYGPDFRRLLEMSFDVQEGYVEWKNKWITFMETLLLFPLINKEKSELLVPTGAFNFKICPSVLISAVEQNLKEGLKGVPVNFKADTRICRTVGLEIKYLEFDTVHRINKSGDCIFEEYKFVPYVHNYKPLNNNINLQKYMIACNTIVDALEKSLRKNLKIGKFLLEGTTDSNVLNGIHNPRNKSKLLEALKEMVSTTGKNIVNERELIFKRYVQDIHEDLANSLLFNEYCLKLMFDIISENSSNSLSVLEINQSSSALLPVVVDVVERCSTLKFQSKVLVCKDIENIDKIELDACNIKLNSYESLTSTVQERNHDVAIGFICVSTKKETQQYIQLLADSVQKHGFILLFHKNQILPPENLLALLAGKEMTVVPETTLEKLIDEEHLAIVSKISDEVSGSLYLLKHRVLQESGDVVQISDNLSWLNDVKTSISKKEKTSWIVSENCPRSGIVGMINCLRQVPGGDKLRCVFIPENAQNQPPAFNFNDPFFKDIISKDLVMNVYKNGTWGSFRHIKIGKELPKMAVDNSYVNMKRHGDLSSFVWMESALNYMEVPEREYVHIYYSAINSSDVMIATGKISSETANGSARLPEIDNSVLGSEFSGRTKYGERIAGICRSRGLSTATQFLPDLSIVVPESWTLEEAATVPIAYVTCYYSLIIRAGLKEGQRILIHSGAEAIGLAAISIALSMKCEVYTTVDTEDKKIYLLKKFPGLISDNIGSSSNTSFEDLVITRTGKKGVDVVLNSLAGEKFYASLRCVSVDGQFVEIGKQHLAMDNTLGLKFFLNNTSFHAISLEHLITSADEAPIRKRVRQLLMEGIRSGVVKPLDRMVFQRDQVEEAFKCMADGKYMGKVLLKIREEEKTKICVPIKERLPAIPITYFYSHKVYIVVEGLSNFGIQISKWLLRKGARNLVLTTQYETRTPYQEFCLKRWREKGYNLIVSMKDASVKDEVSRLLKEASEIGIVGGIFNSTVIRNDIFLEDTDIQKFRQLCGTKVSATGYLDVLSRDMCPGLDHFVCFTSISSGTQAINGYANAVMERICEQRRAEGLPGLVIQWGVIEDVGMDYRQVESDCSISSHKVESCLDILDVACHLNRPVVSSYIVKDSSTEIKQLLKQIARIFGFTDASEVSATRSFAEMGNKDKFVEIKKLLEPTLDATFTLNEIEEMRVQDVRTLLENAPVEENKSAVSTAVVKLPQSFIHSKTLERLNDVQSGVPVFILDIHCDDLSHLRSFGAVINRPAFALVWSAETPSTDVVGLASWYLEKILDITSTEAHIVALSRASVLAMEMVLQNKETKLSLTFTTINGYSCLRKVANKEFKSSEIDILCEFVKKYVPLAGLGLKEQLSFVSNFDAQLQEVMDIFAKWSSEPIDKAKLSEIILSTVKKVQMLEEYSPKDMLSEDLLAIEDFTKLTAADVPKAKDVLSKISSGKVTIQRIADISSFDKDSIQRMASALNLVV